MSFYVALQPSSSSSSSSVAASFSVHSSGKHLRSKMYLIDYPLKNPFKLTNKLLLKIALFFIWSFDPFRILQKRLILAQMFDFHEIICSKYLRLKRLHAKMDFFIFKWSSNAKPKRDRNANFSLRSFRIFFYLQRHRPVLSNKQSFDN